MPIAIKDNIDVAGVRRTVGSRFFADAIAAADAEVTRRLRAAGAVFVGKLALHEFAYGVTGENPHYGRTRNPWALERITGGSSSGAGAAVAAGFCACALGTDTGGSVRVPAALNGVCGLRPTIGRISNRGVFPTAWTFDTVGPLARDVETVAAVFEVLAGFDPGCPVSAPAPAVARGRPDDAVLRLGVVGGFFRDGATDEILRAVRASADALADAGCHVIELDLAGAEETVSTVTIMNRAEAWAVHRERFEAHPEWFGDDVRSRLAEGARVDGAEYAQARHAARGWRRQVVEAFDELDVLLTPATAITAPLAGDGVSSSVPYGLDLVRFALPWSLAGGPSLVVPCGADALGLPIALQLAAAPWREDILFRLGAIFQDVTSWHLRRPPGFADVAA